MAGSRLPTRAGLDVLAPAPWVKKTQACAVQQAVMARRFQARRDADRRDMDSAGTHGEGKI